MAEITISTNPTKINAGGSNGLKSVAIQNTGTVNIFVSQRQSMDPDEPALAGFRLTPGQNLSVDCVACNLKTPWYAGCNYGDEFIAKVNIEELY